MTKKEKRKLGIGTMLLSKLIEILREQKMEPITLEVNENNIPAINLYKKFGLKESHIRKNYYVNDNNETEDAIVMVRTFEVK